MKRTWLVMSLLLVACFAQAEVTYHLEKVNSIVDGGRYVFVRNERAIDITTALFKTSGAPLQTTDQFNMAGISDVSDKTYILTARRISHADHYALSYASCELNITGNNFIISVVVGAAGASWYFTFRADSTAKIYTNNSNYIKAALGGITYTVGGTETNAALFTVYRVMPDRYEREVGSTNLGTICLPFAVEEHDGVDVYQIAYKELDDQSKPSKMYYQLVEGPMEAGRPYIFVPEQKGKLTFTAVPDTYVDKPIVPVDGFYGTFADITDGASLEGKYMINANSQFQLCGAGCNLGANRAYIKMNEVPVKTDVPAPTRRVMVIGEQSEPTFYDPEPGISTGTETPVCSRPATKSMQNGQLIITVGNQHYNTLGQQL